MRTKTCAKAYPEFLNFWRAIASVALLGLLLSGCATNLRKPANEVVFAPGHGVAILEVTPNGQPSALFQKWDMLYVRNAATGERHHTWDGRGRKSARSLFVISLPEGEYYLDSLENFESMQLGSAPIPNTKMTINLTSTNMAYARIVGEELGKFSVRAGKVTNLGMMAYARAKPGQSSNFYVDFLSAKPEFEQALDLLDPSVAASARNGVIPWTPEKKEGQVPWKPEMVYGLSYYLNGPSRAKDGSLYFGEAYGQVARRDPSGKWTWQRTSGASPILSVAALDNGTILAGSEYGGLFFKPAGQEQWRTIPFPLKDTHIYFVDHFPDIGYVAVAYGMEKIHVVAATDINNPTWTTLNTLSANLTVPLPSVFSPIKIWRNGNRLSIGTIAPFEGFSRQIHIHELDTQSKNWRTISVKQGFHNMNSMSVGLDGSLFALSAALGFQDGAISSDGGVSWEKRTSPNWLVASAFRNTDTGFALRQDSMINGERSLWTTTDGGRQWTKSSSAPYNGSHLILLDTPKEMLVVTYESQLYSTKDGGATWSLDR